MRRSLRVRPAHADILGAAAVEGRLSRSWARFLVATIVLGALWLGSTGCDGGAPAGELDTRLETHALVQEVPTAFGLASIRAVAEVHRRADGAPERRVEILRAGLAALSSDGEGGGDELEILRLELAARLCETLLGESGGAVESVALLLPLLSTDRSLPMHKSTARALVTLGDAATSTGDDALAAGSYMRALRMMSLLRQELEP